MEIKSQLVAAELQKRGNLQDFIASIIERNYVVTGNPKDKVKRGPLHHTVAANVGVLHNNVLCAVIKAALRNCGIKEARIQGIQYYRGLQCRTN